MYENDIVGLPKRRYELTKFHKQLVFKYLSGNTTLREMGSIMGISHQGASDFMKRTVFEWVLDGKFKPTDEFIKEFVD